jgi:Domain of unknown function (DUF4440)
MRRLIALVSLCVIMTVPVNAQSLGPQPEAATRAELLHLRDAVWRAWFSNDGAAFERIVPDELLAIGWDGGPWNDRARTMERMREFAATGQVLRSLEFPENAFQQYGDVVLLYSTFRLVVGQKAGEGSTTTTGRASEVFVRRHGRWIHTAWHLDAAPND